MATLHTLLLDVQNISAQPLAGALVEVSYDRQVRLVSGGVVPRLASTPIRIDGAVSPGVQVIASDDPDVTTDSQGFGVKVTVAWSDSGGGRHAEAWMAMVHTSDPGTVNLSSVVGAQPITQNLATVQEIFNAAATAGIKGDDGAPGPKGDKGDPGIPGATDGTVAPILQDTATASYAAAQAAAHAALDTTIARKVTKGAITLSINDYDPTPASIAGVLDQALADGSAQKRVVALGQGTWVSGKAGAHTIASYTGIVGDPSGGTILQFTNAAGGLQLSTSGGTTYEAKLRDITIDGNGAAANLLTGDNIEELQIENTRLQGWTDAAISVTNASLVNTRRLELAGTSATMALPGIRLAASCGSIELSSPNFYQCIPIEITGAVADLRFTGLPWIEDCTDVVTLNNSGSAVSIGLLDVTGHFTTTGSTQRILRTVAASGGNASIRAVVHDAWVNAPNSTSPLFDTSAFAISQVTQVTFRDSVIVAPALTTPLIAVNSAQTWYTWHALVDRLGNASPGAIFSTAPWFPTVGYATGGVYARAIQVSASNDPNGAFSAPPGSIFQRVDTGDVYRKATGFGSTGWVRINTAASVTSGRPAATGVPKGSTWFDTTLNKPIWSNGTGWVDATGTAV